MVDWCRNLEVAFDITNGNDTQKKQKRRRDQPNVMTTMNDTLVEFKIHWIWHVDTQIVD